VLVSGFRSSAGASYRLLQLARYGRFTALATPALFLEYEDVLSRPEQRNVHGFSLEELGRLMSALAMVMVPVDVYYQWRPQLADADDEMVLEAAINGRADAIVTHNVRDFAGVAGNFKLRILSPAQALWEVEG